MTDILFIDESGEVIERFRGVSKAKQKQIVALLSEKQKSKKAVRFVPPTVEQVRAYCEERGNHVDPERFVNHYEASGWKRNRGVPLIDWKAAVRNWEKNDFAGECKKEKSRSEFSSFGTKNLNEEMIELYKKRHERRGEQSGG